MHISKVKPTEKGRPMWVTALALLRTVGECSTMKGGAWMLGA
jgi:hypothetical protein